MGKIIEMPLSVILEEKFLAYAKEVIEDRALPDARDGLKPVQRRIVWSMLESGYLPDGKYKKCARIVGDVMGKYHPHGDSSVYGAMVKLQQPFVRRYPLVLGHGNFGTIDDNPAAMRYTEAKLSPMAMLLVEEIKKNAVDFIPNYDGSEKEPAILPNKVPNLLLNGASGIAVGMTSEIPPHNLKELTEACIALIKRPEISIDELFTMIKGPDFPGGGLVDPEGILKAYKTGTGPIKLRGKLSIENLPGNKQNIVIQAIPYQTSKESILNKITKLVETEYPTQILSIRDESSELVGLRIVIETIEWTGFESFVDALYKKTDLEKNYHCNFVALVNKRPETLDIKSLLQIFINHRIETFVRIKTYDLEKAKKAHHILKGLAIAIENIDAIIKIIRTSKTSTEAKKALINTFSLSQEQAQAILDMRLARLTQLEKDKLKKEIASLEKEIATLESLISSPQKINQAITKELKAIQHEFVDDHRKTEVVSFENIQYKAKTQVVTLQAIGDRYKILSKTYSGSKGITIKVESTDYIYAYLSNGQCHKFPATQIPMTKEPAKIVALFKEKDLCEKEWLCLVSQKAMVKRLPKEELLLKKEYESVMILKDDTLFTCLANDSPDHLVLETRHYQLAFDLEEVRLSSKNSMGVLGMKIEPDDPLKSAILLSAISNRLKKSIVTQKRGGKGKRKTGGKNG